MCIYFTSEAGYKNFQFMIKTYFYIFFIREKIYKCSMYNIWLIHKHLASEMGYKNS